MVVVAGAERAQVDLTGSDLKPRRLQSLAGQLVQKLVQAVIGVRMLGRDAGRQGEVASTQAAEKVLQVPLLEKRGGFGPACLTGQGELIEVLAGLARGKDKRIGERP